MNNTVSQLPLSQSTQHHPKLQRHQQEDFDLKRYLFLLIENWYWFLLSVIISLTATYLVNRYTVKVYKISAALLIENQTNQTNSFLSGNYQGNDMFSGWWLYPDMKLVENQIIILQSFNQVHLTVHSLDFEVSYFRDEVTGRREIYNKAPFIASFDSTDIQPLGVVFSVTAEENGKFRIRAEAGGEFSDCYDYKNEKVVKGIETPDLDKLISFNEPVEGNGYKFRLIPRDTTTISGKAFSGTWYFNFNSYDDLVSAWRGNIAIMPMKKEASILELSVNSDCPDKAMAFLNAHLNMYRQRTLDKKNQFANNTIAFIDKQLQSISDSLGKKEYELQEFRKNNEVLNLDFQAERLFEQLRELENNRAELKLKKEYYNYLKDYLARNTTSGDIVAPSVMGITDPLLNSSVIDLNRLESQRVAMKGSEGSVNPYIASVDMQMLNTKRTIEELLVNMVRSNEIGIENIQKRIDLLMAEVKKLPGTERELLSIERQFKLNDYIYSFLLQRRSEAQIAKASNAPDNEIIDYARISGGPIKPKINLNYIIGLLMGFVIPGLFFILKETFNLKVETEDEVKRITNLPVAGHISHSLRDYYNIVLKDPHSNIAEAFRNLRTRMKFFTREIKSPVILVTSSMPSEGKSFTAVNLASAYSLAGNRTVLVSFDLRRPRTYDEFGFDNSKGITTYLIGRDDISEIIRSTGNENLYIIPSGPVPPNPSELAASEKTAELFRELRSRFDCIIVDSAPIGAVSDTYSIASLADATIILVRHNKTLRQLLKDTIEDCKTNGINNLSILMNDIRSDRRMYGYRGRYGYGYGYGYGYQDKKKL